VRQSAIGGWIQFSTTGILFQEDAASEHRIGVGTYDAHEGNLAEGVTIVTLPSVARIPFRSLAISFDGVARSMETLVPSSATKSMSPNHPAWRD
jgi:hypothetical protein